MERKRPIDANALRKRIEGWITEINETDCTITGSSMEFAFSDALDAIDAAPTIDAKELLSMLWRDTKTNPPAEEDAGRYGKVIVWYKGAWDASTAPWDFVAKMPECYPYWMPLPEPPEEVQDAER